MSLEYDTDSKYTHKRLCDWQEVQTFRHKLQESRMARKFFVGGNFKMNPATRAEKVKLVDMLNKADLDSAVGEYHELRERYRLLMCFVNECIFI